MGETDAKQNRTTEVDSRDKAIIDKEKQLAIEKEMSQYRITPDIDKKAKYDAGNKELREVEADIQLEDAGNPFEEYATRMEHINESSKKLIQSNTLIKAETKHVTWTNKSPSSKTKELPRLPGSEVNDENLNTTKPKQQVSYQSQKI